jgi:alkyl sulfatase BDS1-like metallo-beta-lactamase superfamily hydrolase
MRKRETVRATASRALGQRTTSANARGFYITEALQIEGQLLVQGQPATLDAIRAFVGTPSHADLVAASVDENLQFVRYLVEPRKADGKRLAFTIAAEGDPQIRQVEMRNSVLVITAADAKAATHLEVTRSELADFVLGKGAPSRAGGEVLAELDGVLDRSRLMLPTAMKPAVLDDKGDRDYSHGLEH